jgi:hypothetical protein
MRAMKKITTIRLWAILILAGALPFLLRMGLDTAGARREPIRSIYRGWRWSPAMNNRRNNSEFVFERRQDRSPYESLFVAEMQKDFRINPAGSAPKIRAFFDSGKTVRGRIEVLDLSESPEWQVFESEARYPNNGILLGLWVGLLFLLLGQHLSTCIIASMVCMLTWCSEWNIMDLPRDMFVNSVSFVNEGLARFHTHDWIANEFGRLPSLGAALWLPLASFVLLILFRGKFRKNLNVVRFFLFSFLLEPLALWGASKFAKWDSDTSWLKIYAASTSFRFLSVAVLALYFFRPKEIKQTWERARRASSGFSSWALLIPLAFVASEGWGWLSAVLFEGLPESILRLKCFAVGFLLSAMLGSRIFSLWIATLAVAIMVPPSRGHWSAGAAFGLLFEGLALGWWVTPLKGFLPVVPIDLPKRSLLALITVAWFLGVFLSSVGVPIWLCWLALILAVWAYAQIGFVEDARDDPDLLHPANA